MSGLVWGLSRLSEDTELEYDRSEGMRSCVGGCRSRSSSELLMLLVLTEREHGGVERCDIFKSMHRGRGDGVLEGQREASFVLVATTRLSEACRLCLSPPGPL